MEPDIFGLAAWRKNRGITLEAIALSTKIGVRLLQAIEAGDFRKLPGGIYNTNYIKQYAKAIDFDAAELLAHYQEFCRQGSKETRQAAPQRFPGPLLQS